jgi:hypothetical protein
VGNSLTGSNDPSSITPVMHKTVQRRWRRISTKFVLPGMGLVSLLLASCHSSHRPAEKPAKHVVEHCLKSSDPSDGTVFVIKWKWTTAHIGMHDVSYYTFRYTPDSDDPASYESVRALICERYVTSHTTLETQRQFAGKSEPVTRVVADTNKIVHLHVGDSVPPSSDTSQCLCPKPKRGRQ